MKTKERKLGAPHSDRICNEDKSGFSVLYKTGKALSSLDYYYVLCIIFTIRFMN